MTFEDMPVCLIGGAVADDDGVCVEHKRAGCVVPLPVTSYVAGADIPVPVGGGRYGCARVDTLAPLNADALYTTTVREPNGDTRIERSVDLASAIAVHNLVVDKLRARDEVRRDRFGRPLILPPDDEA